MTAIAARIASGFLMVALLVAGDADAQAVRLCQFKLLNAVQRLEPLTVRICGSDGGCQDREVAAQSLSDVLALPAGHYRFAISVGQAVLDRFSFGLAGDDHDTLVLYGLAGRSVDYGWLTRARRMLGGIDEPLAASYQLMHRMIQLRPGRQGDPPRVVLAHLVPGVAEIRADWQGSQRRVLEPVRYGELGTEVTVATGAAEVSVRLDGAGSSMAKVPGRFRAGSITLVAATAMDGGRLSIITDQRPGPAR